MKKRKKRASATTEQLFAAVKRAREDYDASDAFHALEAGIQNCPEDAGCYAAFKKFNEFQGEQVLTESMRQAIVKAAEDWHAFKIYCPHCSRIVKKNRKSQAYQNYERALKRLQNRLGVHPAAVLGIEIKDASRENTDSENTHVSI